MRAECERPAVAETADHSDSGWVVVNSCVPVEVFAVSPCVSVVINCLATRAALHLEDAIDPARDSFQQTRAIGRMWAGTCQMWALGMATPPDAVPQSNEDLEIALGAEEI